MSTSSNSNSNSNSNKYSQEEYQWMIDLLREARKEIAKGSTDYVCIAILKATRTLGHNGPEYPWEQVGRAADILEDWITESLRTPLGVVGNVICWLYETHGIRLAREDAFHYRLAWIDQMIAILSSPD